MSTVTPPIFIVDGLDIGVFESLRDVELHLEPIGLKNETREIYDSEGRLIRVEAKGNRIIAVVEEPNPKHARELEAALRGFLAEMNEPLAADPGCDLSCLVNAAQKFTSTPTLNSTLKAAWRKVVALFSK